MGSISLEFSWKFLGLVLPWLLKNVSPILISCLFNHRSIFAQLDFFKNLLYPKIACVRCLRLMLHINWARAPKLNKIQPRLLAFLSCMVCLLVWVFACIFAYGCVCSICIYVFVLFVIFAYCYCCHSGEIKMNISPTGRGNFRGGGGPL